MRNRWALLLIIVLAIAAACIIVSTKYGPLRIQMPRPIAYTMIVRGPTVTNQLAKFVQQVEFWTRSTTSQQRRAALSLPW